MSKKFNYQDFYFKKAKKQNYTARSIFKLEEIDKKFKLFKKNQSVLDLGASPGSWSQYVSEKVGIDQGLVVGLDLKPIELNLPNAHFFEFDAFDANLNQLLQKNALPQSFDWLISDMAPKTTGVQFADQEKSYQLCLRALELSRTHLKDGGGLVVKYFHGPDYQDLMSAFKSQFKKTQSFRPKSTRKESKEIFLIGLGYRRQDPGAN